MKITGAIREVMKMQGVGTNKMADRMNRPPRFVSDRLRLENIIFDLSREKNIKKTLDIMSASRKTLDEAIRNPITQRF